MKKFTTRSAIARILAMISAIVMILSTGFVAFASQPGENIASVNGEYISYDTYVDMMELMAGETCANILSELVVEKLIYQGAESNGVVITDDDIARTVESLKAENGEDFFKMLAEYGATEEDFISSLKLELTLMGLCTSGVEVTEEEVRDYFEQNKVALSQGETFDISHILLDTEVEALSVAAELKKGVSFEDLASTRSTDGNTNGGYLGRFSKGQLIDELDSVIFTMEIGQISEPVKTSLGYHIIKVNDVIPAKEADFEEYRGVIELMLASQKAKNPQDIVTELAQNADIVVFDQKFSAFGRVEETNAADYIAMVNGEPIEAKRYVEMLEPMYGSDAINQLVGQMLLEQAIEEYEIDIDGLVEDEINGITEELGGEYYLGYFLQQNGITEAELRENMRVELALKEIAIKDVVVSDDEVEEYFESHASEFDVPEKIRASHILVDSKDYAQDIKTQIDEGADFFKIAKANSLDEGSSDAGGDLGYFMRGDMIQEFEDAAFSLEIGEVSEPVESMYGYHIIKLVDRIPEQKATLDNSRALVEVVIKESKAKSYEEVLDEMFENATIEVFDEKYQISENVVPEL